MSEVRTVRDLTIAPLTPALWEAEVDAQLKQLIFYTSKRRGRKVLPEVRRAMITAALIELDWLVWEYEAYLDKQESTRGLETDTTIEMPAEQTDDTVISEAIERHPVVVVDNK